MVPLAEKLPHVRSRGDDAACGNLHGQPPPPSSLPSKTIPLSYIFEPPQILPLQMTKGRAKERDSVPPRVNRSVKRNGKKNLVGKVKEKREKV
ncbi:hypothetical protein M0804_000307 [Polistes exclamans]|nr:hypothetical protein M0804_000307 [Polistes exclamans]